MTVPLLEVKDLDVSFGAGDTQISAVKGASFSINSGETVALVGESGSGKSVSALSILQLLPYPIASHSARSSITFKSMQLVASDTKTLMGVRGNRISMIFQEPMTSLNPLHVIEKQISEETGSYKVFFYNFSPVGQNVIHSWDNQQSDHQKKTSLSLIHISEPTRPY